MTTSNWLVVEIRLKNVQSSVSHFIYLLSWTLDQKTLTIHFTNYLVRSFFSNFLIDSIEAKNASAFGTSLGSRSFLAMHRTRRPWWFFGPSAVVRHCLGWIRWIWMNDDECLSSLMSLIIHSFSEVEKNLNVFRHVPTILVLGTHASQRLDAWMVTSIDFPHVENIWDGVWLSLICYDIINKCDDCDKPSEHNRFQALQLWHAQY